MSPSSAVPVNPRALPASAVLVLLLFLTAPLAAQVRDEYHPAPRDTVTNDVYQGWKQFELNCSRCHGEYGVGTSFAPALIVSMKDDGTIPTKELFITTVCAGRPDKGMPSWCALGLEMDKIQRIYLYLKGRADGKIGIGRPAVKENS
jgi:mono/diheme cytochrome c family protein